MTFSRSTTARRDAGFTLVEMLIVVVVLGALALVAALSVRGMTETGQTGVCDSDRTTIASAVDLYMFQNSVDTIPGDDATERMDTLVEAGLLRSASHSYAVAADGSLTGIGNCAA